MGYVLHTGGHLDATPEINPGDIWVSVCKVHDGNADDGDHHHDH